MSAFVVSKTHVDLMVRAALHYGGQRYSSFDGQGGHSTSAGLSWWRVDEDGGYAGWHEVDRYAEDKPGDDYKQYVTPSQLGQILVSENAASVCHRYPDCDPDATDPEGEGFLPGPCDAYYVMPYVYSDPGYVLTPAEVFKAIDCLDYQSCEHPEWRKSEAFAFCASLREAACGWVDGYAEAPWEFDSIPEVAGREP